jgi:hypothetical protein
MTKEEILRKNYECHPDAARAIEEAQRVTADATVGEILDVCMTLMVANCAVSYGKEASQEFQQKAHEFANRHPLGSPNPPERMVQLNRCLQMATALNEAWADMQPQISVRASEVALYSITAAAWYQVGGEEAREGWCEILRDWVRRWDSGQVAQDETEVGALTTQVAGAREKVEAQLTDGDGCCACGTKLSGEEEELPEGAFINPVTGAVEVFFQASKVDQEEMAHASRRMGLAFNEVVDELDAHLPDSALTLINFVADTFSLGGRFEVAEVWLTMVAEDFEFNIRPGEKYRVEIPRRLREALYENLLPRGWNELGLVKRSKVLGIALNVAANALRGVVRKCYGETGAKRIEEILDTCASLSFGVAAGVVN